jgi:hypothetical protein
LRILKGTVIGMAVAATLQPVSAAPHPTTPKDTRVNSNPDAEYGWGPFRTVDW